MADNKIPREAQTRETEQKVKQWTPPEHLPSPDPEPGYKHRWIRMSTLGDYDPTNMSSKTREGWEPVKLSDQPKYSLMTDGDQKSKFPDAIVIGGLILCKMPEEMVAQRNAYYENMTKSNMEAVTNAYTTQADPRMPVFREHSTKVSKFGDGI